MTPAQKKLTAKRFLGMLEHKRPTCDCCPFAPNYKEMMGWIKPWDSDNRPCWMCREATGIPESCPCWYLPPREAMKRAWLFIEESGILEERRESR